MKLLFTTLQSLMHQSTLVSLIQVFLHGELTDKDFEKTIYIYRHAKDGNGRHLFL